MSSELHVRPREETIYGGVSQDGNVRDPMSGAANDAGLARFHAGPDAQPSNLTGKIVGAIVVVLMLVAGGGYLYTLYGHMPAPPVADSQLPTTPPAQ